MRRRPDVLWRRSLEAVVLLPVDAGDVLTLGGTGPAVWDLLAEWRTFDDLVAVLAAAYGASPAQVAADLEPLIAELEALRALERAAESGGPQRE
jgi:hypothetical protein